VPGSVKSLGDELMHIALLAPDGDAQVPMGAVDLQQPRPPGRVLRRRARHRGRATPRRRRPAACAHDEGTFTAPAARVRRRQRTVAQLAEAPHGDRPANASTRAGDVPDQPHRFGKGFVCVPRQLPGNRAERWRQPYTSPPPTPPPHATHAHPPIRLIPCSPAPLLTARQPHARGWLG